MNEIKKKRKELGLTQEQAAKACGVSRRTLQTYEETNVKNSTYYRLLIKLDEMNDLNSILGLKSIKSAAKKVFLKHPGVKCAYLYGSYARGEATVESDVDILVVCHAMGLEFYGMYGELKDILHKEIDLQTHRQIVDSESMIEDILVEAIKIYQK